MIKLNYHHRTYSSNLLSSIVNYISIKWNIFFTIIFSLYMTILYHRQETDFLLSNSKILESFSRYISTLRLQQNFKPLRFVRSLSSYILFDTKSRMIFRSILYIVCDKIIYNDHNNVYKLYVLTDLVITYNGFLLF